MRLRISPRAGYKPRMLTFLAISLPIFAVVGLGAFASLRRVLPPDTAQVLNWFAFNVAVPALMVRVIARQPVEALMNGPFFLAMLVSSAGLFAAAAVASKLFERQGLAVAASRGQGATIGNLGFLGIPLLFAFFGDRAAGPLAIVSIVDLFVIIPLAIGLMQAAEGGGSPGRRALTLVKGAVLNPFMLSVLTGLIIAFARIPLPEPVDRFLVFLGAGAGPAALFALGISLTAWRARTGLPVVVGLSVAKLVIHPVLAYVMLAWVMRLDPLWVQAGVLFTALPIATNVYMIASRHNANPEPIAAAIVATTVIASLTFPLTAWLVGV